RCDVASGIARLASMFSAMRAAAPRIGISASLESAVTGAVAGPGAATAVTPPGGFSAAGAFPASAGADGRPLPSRASSDPSFHLSSTPARSCKFSSYSSSQSQLLIPKSLSDFPPIVAVLLSSLMIQERSSPRGWPLANRSVFVSLLAAAQDQLPSRDERKRCAHVFCDRKAAARR